MRLLRLLALSFTLCVALPARSATDYTDIWWAAGGVESGWGINLAQNSNTIFATFFIYNTSGQPVWYTALLSRTIGETFTGPVSVSSGGAWFGSPVWTPPLPAVTVGSATFVGQAPHRGLLTYTIDSVPVVKTIERTTLAPLTVAGNFLGGISARESAACTNAGTLFENDQFIITQTGSPGTVRIDQLDASNSNLICSFEGAGVQYGGVIDIPSAAYTCGTSFSGTAHVIGLRPTATGIEARWFSDFGSGCTESGNLSGVTQTP